MPLDIGRSFGGIRKTFALHDVERLFEQLALSGYCT